MPGACPATEQLAAALRGKQSSSAEAELAAHLAECANCRARLEELAGGSGWLETRAKARGASLPPASESLHKAIEALESHAPGQEVKPETTAPLSFLQPPDQPGILGRFGPYEVLAQVAIGGMGIVLKARDPGLNRIVALKILPPALAANSLARARFIREARAAAAVVHEHVVPIYAVDECAGLPYLVMQFIEGRPSSERIRASGPLRLEEILRIGAQTAAGLAAAHAQGLIHRDVKPGNILLENGVERVKITDFGLARAADDSSLTREGYIAGTPEYMSPEQARNEPVDQRADLFSFGCVLYEMAAGVSPFHAEKPLVAMRRVCDEEPPPAHTLNPKLPGWLSQLIQRLMAKHAAARPQTAAEVAAELGRRLAESQQSPSAIPFASPPEPRSKFVLRPAWAAVLVLALALAFFVIHSMRTKSPGDPQAVMTPSHPPSLPFVIPASDGGEAREFASLNEAVAAAAPGSVIELRFNGSYASPPIHLDRKPLILRAAPGFEPVLTATEPVTELLSARAALVLEGLTIRTAEQAVPAAGGSRQPAVPRDYGIHVADAPNLVAHCRFELVPLADNTQRRRPGNLQLLNVTTAVLRRSEFVNPIGPVLQWHARPSTESSDPGHRLSFEDGIVLGSFASLVGRWPQPAHLELRRTTVAGEFLLVMPQPGTRREGQPEYRMSASQCLFDVEALLQQPARTKRWPLEEVLSWQGGSNIFSVRRTYADTTPALISHEEWLASAATSETNSLATELGVKGRLDNLTGRTRAAEVAALALTAEERQQLTAQGWTSTEPPGADPRRTGPGKPYHDWRKSPDYAEWLKLVREHIPQSAASP